MSKTEIKKNETNYERNEKMKCTMKEMKWNEMNEMKWNVNEWNEMKKWNVLWKKKIFPIYLFEYGYIFVFLIALIKTFLD